MSKSDPELEEEEFLCDQCGQPVDIEGDYHDGHETHCPNYGQQNTDRYPEFPCDCDLHFHPECDPECKLLKERESLP